MNMGYLRMYTESSFLLAHHCLICDSQNDLSFVLVRFHVPESKLVNLLTESIYGYILMSICDLMPIKYSIDNWKQLAIFEMRATLTPKLVCEALLELSRPRAQCGAHNLQSFR